jgi:hypothetical protein
MEHRITAPRTSRENAPDHKGTLSRSTMQSLTTPHSDGPTQERDQAGERARCSGRQNTRL